MRLSSIDNRPVGLVLYRHNPPLATCMGYVLSRYMLYIQSMLIYLFLTRRAVLFVGGFPLFGGAGVGPLKLALFGAAPVCLSIARRHTMTALIHECVSPLCSIICPFRTRCGRFPFADNAHFSTAYGHISSSHIVADILVNIRYVMLS